MHASAPSECPNCPNPIRVGQEIVRQEQEQLAHADCRDGISGFRPGTMTDYAKARFRQDRYPAM